MVCGKGLGLALIYISLIKVPCRHLDENITLTNFGRFQKSFISTKKLDLEGVSNHNPRGTLQPQVLKFAGVDTKTNRKLDQD